MQNLGGNCNIIIWLVKLFLLNYKNKSLAKAWVLITNLYEIKIEWFFEEN